MEKTTNSPKKKEWQAPDFYLLDSPVNAKHLGSNEAYFTKTVPIGNGSYKFYHNNISQGFGPTKLSSVNS